MSEPGPSTGPGRGPGPEWALLPVPRRVALRSPVSPAGDPDAVPVHFDARLPAQGYRLELDGPRTRIVAADAAGAFYATRTLRQITRLAGGWPHGEVEDHPDLAVRGVMLDISRDKVPTMATLRALIEQLADWKINHLEFYVEHTFAHPGHEQVWADASPLHAEEVAEIDRWCRELHIELVPNQNTLGHMERFLVHPAYRDLALAPDGFRWGGFLPRPPCTLDPGREASFTLVHGLLRDWVQALPDARRVHVGLDEPWELPAERMGEYGEWLGRLRALPELAGRELLVWGDILAAHPELMPSVPPGVTVCEWGYEADHPWPERLDVLEQAGLAAWIAPGTSSWMSLLGRTTNMLANVGAALDAARSRPVHGMLLTDWGDWGHHQYLPVSLPGLAWAAAQSWCRDENRYLDLAAALDAHCHEATGPGYGAALLHLGDAYRAAGQAVPNLAPCFLHLWLPQMPVGRGPTRGLTPAGLDAVEERLGEGGNLGRLPAELDTTVALARIVLDDARARLAGDGTLASIPTAGREQLAGRLDPVIEAHREHWLARNRPGGLADSVAWFEHLQRCYRRGAADPDWGGPLRLRT